MESSRSGDQPSAAPCWCGVKASCAWEQWYRGAASRRAGWCTGGHAKAANEPLMVSVSTGLWQHGQRSIRAHVSPGAQVWTLRVVPCGGHIVARSSPWGRMGARAAPWLQTASDQLLRQQVCFPSSYRCSHRCQVYLLILSLLFLQPRGGSSHSGTEGCQTPGCAGFPNKDVLPLLQRGMA